MTNQMTKNYEINVNQNVFDVVLPNDFNNHGFQICGIIVDEMKNVYDDVEFVEMTKKLPDEITSNDMNFLIKSDNLKTFITNHILMKSENDENNFCKMIDIIKKNEPHKIDNDNNLKFEYMNDFVDFIYDELIKTSKLKINNQMIYVIDYSNDDFEKMQIDVIQKYYKK